MVVSKMSLILCYSVQCTMIYEMLYGPNLSKQLVGTSNGLQNNDERLNALLDRFQPSTMDNGKTAGTVKRIYRDVVHCV